MGYCKRKCAGDRKSSRVISNKLTFLRNELIYDIENYSFVAGDIMPVDDEHLKHQVFDIAQDGNEDLVTRILNLAHAECVEILYPYTKTTCINDEEFNDALKIPAQYDIELSLPAQFSRNTVILLKELIHDYLVCRVLIEWSGITLPALQPFWQERIVLIKARIKQALLSRREPLRRGQSMF